MTAEAKIDFVGDLVKDLSRVRQEGAVYIFCAEASPFVYSNPAFLEAAREAKIRKHAKIQIMAASILLMDGQGSNGLLTLTEEGVIEGLYHRQARGSDAHFRVIETDEGLKRWVEFPHDALESLEERLPGSLSPVFSGSPSFYLNIFEGYKHHTERLSETVFLALEVNLRILMNEVEKQGRVFDYFSVTELASIPNIDSMLKKYVPSRRY